MKAAMQIIRDADRGQLLTDMQFGLDDIANAIEKNGGGRRRDHPQFQDQA